MAAPRETMLYRPMKGFRDGLSILGAGCMRLPVDADGRIDEDQSTSMLHLAIDRGVNLVDTAWPYHGGESEPFVGRALQGGWRDRVALSTKLPSWLVNTRSDMDRYLDRQLERLRTDHVDLYLVHALDRATWRRMRDLGVGGFLESAIADGRIRHAGFSFHDDLDAFREILDGWSWEFCLVQVNFMDEQYQAGIEGVRYAAAKGLNVFAMEPLRGGVLAREVPGVREIWDRAPVRRDLADWALRWVWDHAEITTVLSGMSSLEQVVRNLDHAQTGLPGCLTAAERALYAEVRAIYESRIAVPCTRCAYCMPCPAGVDIPTCFETHNVAHMYDATAYAKSQYDFFLHSGPDGQPAPASACTECGTCEEKCPQHIAVRDRLKDVVAHFGR